MRITLGYAWQSHAPDETIEVPDRIGRQLIHDGKARRADDEVAAEREAAEQAAADAPEPAPLEPPFAQMKTAELHAFAKRQGITIPPDVRTRRDLIAALRPTKTRAPRTKRTPKPPVDGDQHEEA